MNYKWFRIFLLIVFSVLFLHIGVRTSLAGCVEECPGSDNVLRNCHPVDSDGTSIDSLCNSARRTEPCGGQMFCCPRAGGRWTKNMAACTTPTCNV